MNTTMPQTPDAAGWALSAGQAPWELAHERTENGVPVYRYRKTILRTGDFVKAADGLRFQITDADLAHFRDTFLAMHAAGVKIPVPLGHSFEADKNRGYVVDLFQRPGELEAVLDLYGQDAPNLAATNDVSIYAPAEFTDGNGKTYRRPIVHVALTPYPVVTGLGPFQAIAASLVTAEKPAVDFKKLKESLGIAEELTDANAADLICGAFGGLRKELDDLKVAAKTAADEKAKAATAGTKEGTGTSDPIVASLRSHALKVEGENRRMKLDGLVAKSRITPAVRDKLHALYASEAALSLSLSGGDQFDELVKTLETNEPKPVGGEKTGAQVLELSNPAAGGQTNPLLADAQRRAEAAKK